MKKIFITIFLTVLWTPLVEAQKPIDTSTGSRVERPVDGPAMRQRDQNRIRAKMLKCIYEWSPKRLDAFLDSSDPLTVDYVAINLPTKNWIAALHVNTCFERSAEHESDDDLYVSMSDRQFRGWLLPFAYIAHHPTSPSWVSQWPGDPKRRYISTDGALEVAKISGSFSDCVVKAAPLLADQLVRTEASSPEEKSAIKAIVPFLGPCIVAGQTIELKPNNLRVFLADGLWTASRSFAAGQFAEKTN